MQLIPTSKTLIHDFCKRHEISTRELMKMLREHSGDPCGSATIQRLFTGTLSEAVHVRIMNNLSSILPAFLQKKGWNAQQIDAELLPIFASGEYEPMITQRYELSAELCKHFGFTDREGKPLDPFRNTPQSKDEVFISADLRAVVDRLLDAIRYQGFVSVTGDIGSGKTTLRALLEDHVMSHENLRLVWPEFFDMSVISPMHIADAILAEFGQMHRTSAVKRKSAVNNLLAAETRRGNRVAIAFDECHRLNDRAISSLKNFLEMSSGGFQKYLGVILFGQPQFDSRLAEPQFREIFERIVSIQMPDFKASAPEYLAHRLNMAGVRDIKKIFDPEAIALICDNASTPLALGNIANKALTISKQEFGNDQVNGAAIKTKMFFAERKQGFARRAA